MTPPDLVTHAVLAFRVRVGDHYEFLTLERLLEMIAAMPSCLTTPPFTSDAFPSCSSPVMIYGEPLEVCLVEAIACKAFAWKPSKPEGVR